MIVVPQPVAAPTPDAPSVEVVPDPVVAPLSWRWISWTGESWELTDWGSPIVKLKGATGLGPVNPTHLWTDNSPGDGSTWDDMRRERGELFMPLMVRGSDSADWIEQYRRFLTSLDARREGRMRVTHPTGHWREALCRYESGADFTLDIDPVKSRRGTYGITWAMAQPYWLGEPVVQRFEFDPGLPFFPGPPFHLALSNALSNATVVNPGHESAHALWRVDGPFTGYTVGVGDAVVSAVASKPLGGWVEIDTTPGQLTVLDEAGVDQWLTLTDVDFSAIPAGTSQLVTNVAGAGAGTAVTLSFVPRYNGVL